MSMTFDFKEFNRRLEKLDENFTGKWAEKGMFNAINALKIDADTIPPTTPKKIGILRTEVKREVTQKKDSVVGELEYEMPYAAYQHRGKRQSGSHVVKNYSEPGSGKEFVSKKQKLFGEKYRNIIGLTLKAQK